MKVAGFKLLYFTRIEVCMDGAIVISNLESVVYTPE